MKYKYSYQIPLEYKGQVEHEFDGNSITIRHDGLEDVFDFSSIEQDGRVEEYETIFPFRPLLNVERIEGVWYMELLQFVTDGEDVWALRDAEMERDWRDSDGED